MRRLKDTGDAITTICGRDTFVQREVNVAYHVDPVARAEILR